MSYRVTRASGSNLGNYEEGGGGGITFAGIRLAGSTYSRTPYTSIACAAGVVAGAVDRDSSRYRYRGNRRTRQLALDCEGSRVKSTHDEYESTWKCGELKLLFFSPIHRRMKNINK